MKRKSILILLATLWGSLASFAFDYTVSFDYSKVSVKNVEYNDSNYSEIQYQGLVNGGEANKPSLPVMQVKISVPYNATDIKLSAKPGFKTTIKTDFPLLPVISELAELIPGSEIIEHPIEDLTTTLDTVAHIANIGYAYGGHKIVTVEVSPIVGYQNSNKANFYSSIQLNCTWTTSNDLSNEPIKYVGGPMIAASMDKVKSMVVNPNNVFVHSLQLATPLSVDADDSGIIDYLIIAPDEFCDALQELKQIRRMKGYRSEIVPLSEILDSGLYPGDDIGPTLITDDAGKIRKYLQTRYENDGIKNVLLAGKYPKMPIRYVDFGSNRFDTPTDLYFSDFSTKWNVSHDNKYSAVNRRFDVYSEVNLGRIPFENVDEINNYISKLKIYEFTPGNGDPSYLGKVIITRDGKSDIVDNFYDKVVKHIINAYDGNAIFLDNTEASDIVNKLKTENFGSWQFIGHGSPDGIMTWRGSKQYDHGGLLALDGEYVYMHPQTSAGIDQVQNKYFPGWQYSISCTLMPFDIYEPTPGDVYNVKKNFGESYILGKNYGGVAIIGNTREYWIPDGVKGISSFFPKLSEYYKNNEHTYPLTAGDKISEVRTYPFTFMDFHGSLMPNLFGDPLVPLFIKEPNKLSCSEKYNGNKYIYKITNTSTDKLLFGCMDLKLRYAADLHQVTDEKLSSIDILPNKIQTIYGKNTLPCVLPVHLYGTTFFDTEFFCDRLFIQNYLISTLKKNADQIDNDGKVLIAKDHKLKIHAMGYTFIDNLLQLSENSTFELYCDNDVEIDNVYVPKGAKLIINARNIYLGDYGVTKHAEGTVELISRDKSQKKIRSRSTTEKKLAIEGRTWWYKSDRRIIDEMQEFGIRIGEEVTIDGEKWNKVTLAMYNTPHQHGTEAQIVTDTLTIAYLKDTGRAVSSVSLSLSTDSLIAALTEYMHFSDNPKYPFNLYTFGDMDETCDYGLWKWKESYKITDIQKITNAGISYTKYSTTPSEDGHILYDSYEYIEGIGHPKYFLLFPFGGGTMSNTGWDDPELTYVTDGDDHRVIYEAAGGKKIWEQAGVEAVTVDSKDAQPEWYTLQGVKIDSPTAPGVYIRRIGSNSEKVVVK